MTKMTLNSLLRADFVSFIIKCFHTLNPGVELVDAWYVEYLAWELLRCQEGQCRRMVIALPPRYGKSTIVSVAFPAWLLGHNPSLRIICASYSQELAFRLSSDFRRIIESPWYRELFPSFALAGGTCTDRAVNTTANGWRYATSVGGPLTGIGGDFIIIDDAIKAADALSEVERQNVFDWITGTVASRLDNKSKGSIIVVGQRLHIDDPGGRLLATGAWREVALPARATETRSYPLARINGEATHIRQIGDVLDPVREPPPVLDEIRATMGAAAFNAQYQQQPEFDNDCFIRWEWFFPYDQTPKFDYVFMSVDPAYATHSNADYTAALVIGVVGKKDYILHVERKRLEFTPLTDRLLQLIERYNVDGILIENGGVGSILYQHLRDRLHQKVHKIQPTTGKQDRVIRVLPKIECGQVGVPLAAPWLEVFRIEAGAFPNGAHDDQVDALSQYLAYRDKMIIRTAGITIAILGKVAPALMT